MADPLAGLQDVTDGPQLAEWLYTRQHALATFLAATEAVNRVARDCGLYRPVSMWPAERVALAVSEIRQRLTMRNP